MITTFYPPYHFGGDALYVQQLARGLAELGHEVQVVHCLDSYNLLSRAPPELADRQVPNLTVHRLASRFGALSPLATHQTGRPIFKSRSLRQILSQPFDVIHYHNISLIGGPGILSFGDALKIYTLHEYWLLCPTHMLFKFDREICTSRQCITCTLAHGRPPQLWRYTHLLERSISEVDMFIAPSAYTEAKHRGILRGSRVEHLPYFTSRWNHASDSGEAPGEARPYLLFVGRLEKIKGLQTLIEAFHGYPDAELLVAGTGEYESSLRQQAGNCPHIRFLGFQTGARLRRLYRDAIAVIVPSVWEEVFGIVMLEAFAQKTPVVVRNRGGMPEVVRTSGGGFVYETNTELLAAIGRLIREPGLRDDLGRRGHQALQQHWTAEVHLRKYLGLIHSLNEAAAGAAPRPSEAATPSA